MLCGENVTVKQLVYLLISCGFRKCELWTQKAYINANCKTKTLRSHRIASKKIDLLHEAGLAYPMRRKTPCFSYGDIRRVHRIYASN